MIPGYLLHRIAACICSAKTLERIVEPAIADLQKEYRSADAARLWRRGWILLVGYCAILKVIVICAFSVPVISDADRRALVRALAWSSAMVLVIVALFTLPFLYEHYDAVGLQGAMWVVPQALPLAIPIGIAFGLAFGLSARPTGNLAKATLLGALAASALSFVILAWGLPAASQSFRELTSRQPRASGHRGAITAPKGHSEMTFSELRQEAHSAADGEPGRARQIAFSFHRRFSLGAATLALVSVLLAASSSHRAARGVFAFTACVAYWILMFAGEMGNRRGYLPVPIGAWVPNLALIGLAIVIMSWRSSRLRGALTPAG